MQCYRHPDREAYVRCQRCERYICPACQTEAAVGFLCPEDAGISRARETVDRITPRPMRNMVAAGAPIATYSIIAICVLVWLGQLAIPSITVDFSYWPLATAYEPWRMITSAFLHDPYSPLHILLNMWSLWVIGRQLEEVLGTRAFLTVYLVSAFGGSVGMIVAAPSNEYAYGASGAIFGLMGAFFVVLRSFGMQTNNLVFIVAVNLALGFIGSGVAWQAHVGGLITGLAVAFVFSKTRGARDGRKRFLGVLLICLALVALTLYGIFRVTAGL